MTLNGGKKKSDRLETLGLKEYQGGEYPRFYFCLTYCRSDAKEFRNTSGHRQICVLKSQKSLSQTQHQEKGSLEIQKTFRKQILYPSQISQKKTLATPNKQRLSEEPQLLIMRYPNTPARVVSEKAKQRAWTFISIPPPHTPTVQWILHWTGESGLLPSPSNNEISSTTVSLQTMWGARTSTSSSNEELFPPIQCQNRPSGESRLLPPPSSNKVATLLSWSGIRESELELKF